MACVCDSYAAAPDDYASVHRDDVLNEFAPGANRTLTSDMIGAPVAPEGGGYMPLSQAAYCIVTNGGTKSISV